MEVTKLTWTRVSLVSLATKQAKQMGITKMLIGECCKLHKNARNHGNADNWVLVVGDFVAETLWPAHPNGPRCSKAGLSCRATLTQSIKATPTPENLDLILADVKGALIQSTEGMRDEPLYVKLPRAGSPPDHQGVGLAKLTRENYCLVTGPVAWPPMRLSSAHIAGFSIHPLWPVLLTSYEAMWTTSDGRVHPAKPPGKATWNEHTLRLVVLVQTDDLCAAAMGVCKTKQWWLSDKMDAGADSQGMDSDSYGEACPPDVEGHWGNKHDQCHGDALSEAQWDRSWWKLAIDSQYELKRFNSREMSTQSINTHELDHSLIVFMDSKSVYDIEENVKPSFGGIDRRAALEARVDINAMKTSGASARWIPRKRDLAIESGAYGFESETQTESAVQKARKQFMNDTEKANPRPMRSMAWRFDELTLLICKRIKITTASN
eukprot:2691360-Amphidinium_carterae.2